MVPQSLDVADLEVASAGAGTGGLPSAARENLGKLGFGLPLLRVPWRALSGGEKMKLLLARALAQAGEIILLDEPTNHLDLPAVLWLEEWLLRFRGAAIVISHDRRFLDRVVTRIDELDEGGMRTFPGNYSAYAAQKRREWETAWQEYRAYQAKKEQLERVLGSDDEVRGAEVRAEVRTTDASAADDRLLLESRLAHLGGLLAKKGLSSEEYAVLENEYLATAKALADVKRRRGASNPKPCLF